MRAKENAEVRNLADSESSLRESEARFRDLIELSSDWYWEQDADLRYTILSGGVLLTAGFRPQDSIGKTRREQPGLGLSEEEWAAHQAVLDAHQPFYDFTYKRINPDGKTRYVCISGRPVFDPQGKFKGYRGVGRDITKRVNADNVLNESEARFRDLIELFSDWYWEQDENLRYTILSGGVLQKAGLRPLDSIGKTRREQPGIVLSEEEWAAHQAVLDAHQPFYDLTYKRVNPKGETRYVSISGRPIFDAQGKFRGYRGIGKDITEHVLAEDLEYLAYHDALTTLPNRTMFSQILNRGIRQAHRRNTRLAVLFLDLDGFKNINDTLGHNAGDLLLQEVGTRVKRSLRDSDIVARLGGDEFVVLLEEVSQSRPVRTVADKILSAIVKPFRIVGQEVSVTVSIGISIYPDDGKDQPSLMKAADIAMYRAKVQGKNNYQFYFEKTDTP